MTTKGRKNTNRAMLSILDLDIKKLGCKMLKCPTSSFSVLLKRVIRQIYKGKFDHFTVVTKTGINNTSKRVDTLMYPAYLPLDDLIAMPEKVT